MPALTKAQRAGIVERLKYNRKYSAVILYAGNSVELEAAEFASVLQEAGWSISGVSVNERVPAEGLRIGVHDLASPCPSARLLLDVLVSVGLDDGLVRTAEAPYSTLSSDCCVLVGTRARVHLARFKERRADRM
jgi:hypothetical protein